MLIKSLKKYSAIFWCLGVYPSSANTPILGLILFITPINIGVKTRAPVISPIHQAKNVSLKEVSEGASPYNNRMATIDMVRLVKQTVNKK